ncbi:XTP/dITP diphosphatase [Vallitalea okinawensis]|uniref:XTP/dITP diphosphatase n=1 Tax=Vallitalea okinawensis TaxID=2078660 RepID=UPI000CFA9404|nr:XTP/dITP diphosphatase [Vallitalea okinawensis]
MDKIIFATKNKKKLVEINEILVGTGLEVISMEDAGIDIDVVEDGSTFEENALKKATEIMKVSGKIVLADDSGLEVDYLDKAPGIYSARFAGKETSYSIKNQMIIDKLDGVPDEQRIARFVCAIAVAYPNGDTKVVRENFEGRIAYQPDGENGFGYDPIFYVPEYEMTSAKMSRDLKNEISHRGKALRKMKEVLLANESTSH